MGNVNTIVRLVNLPGPAVVTTETCVAAPTGVLTPYGASTAATPIRATLAVPPNLWDTSPAQAQKFRIRWAASAVQPAASTFTVNTYLAVASPANTNLTTLTSDIKMFTHASTLASANGGLYGSGIVLWHPGTGELSCFYGEGGNVVVTTPVVLAASMAVGATNPVVASSATTYPALTFYVTFTSSTNAPTSTTLNEFAIEAI